MNGFEMTKEMRAFEASMQLKDLKAGDNLTERHLSALNFFIGDLLEAARKIPLQEIKIEFPNGVPTVTKNDTGIGIEVKMIEDEEP